MIIAIDRSMYISGFSGFLVCFSYYLPDYRDFIYCHLFFWELDFMVSVPGQLPFGPLHLLFPSSSSSSPLINLESTE
ncbi:hypothetical protein DERF_006020 [Dermatophagoides farinae]|uniref:Uncharacterized protein n=1 Tax=Dermatophagoides farinae TaxID=6954 RepID=A0A922I5F3_DERFA|nr:hypothetical protein DERF_006020 [Dermatophagoides farinae]